MIQHEAILHINRPVEQVFAYVTDLSKVKNWQDDVEVIESLMRGPLRVGAQFREVRHVNGKRTENRGQVMALEPNKRFETRTTTKPQVLVSYAFAEEDGGTKLTYKFSLETAGTMRLMQGMLARGIKLQQDAALAKLKSVLEG
jgi:uncharacterized protein YndB with AHSA1/START domain